MTIIIYAILIVYTVCSLRKPINGLCFLLAIRILIPDNVRVQPLDLSLNTSCSLLLWGAWIVNMMNGRCRSNKHDKLSRFLQLFTLYCAINILFSPYSPIGRQLHTFAQYVILQFVPVIITINLVRKSDDLNRIIKVFALSSAICASYSLLCFFLKIPYPYNAWINTYFPARDEDIAFVMTAEYGNVAGRCMGTATSGTYDYGMVISILFITMCCLYYKYRSKLLLLGTVLCGIDVLCTTRRAPIVTGMLFLLVMLLLESKNVFRKVGTIFLTVLVALVVLYLFPAFTKFRNVIESSIFFWDDSVASANDVTGSSVELRLYQLRTAIRFIDDNLLFGNGWGAMYYKVVPGMNGWESILLTVLAQFGLLGIILWSILFWKLYKYSNMGIPHQATAIAFSISAFSLCILTDTIYPFFIYFGATILNKIYTIRELKNVVR